MRKRIIIISLIFAVIICFYTTEKTYSTIESFCQENNINALATICGEETVLIFYQESPGECKFAFLKESGGEFVSIGFREVKKRIYDSNYEVIYKGNGTDEHYIVLMLTTTSVIPEIKDSVSSSFYYIPIEFPANEQQVIGYYAIAYVGDKSDNFYLNDYSYEMGRTSGTD